MESMKITKKVMIIIIVITLSTIALSIYISRTTIKNLCSREVDRSLGRTMGVLSTFNEIMDDLSESSDRLSEWIELADNENFYINKKINISEKIYENKYSNIYLLNSNFEIKYILKENYNYVNNQEMNTIIKLVHEQNSSNLENVKFSGVISTAYYQYMISLKSVYSQFEGPGYLLILEPFSGDIYKDSESFSGFVFVEKLKEEDILMSFEKITIGPRTIYINYSNDIVKSYSKIESYGDGGNIYISLTEEPQVIESVKSNLNKFMTIIVLIFIIANFIMYFSIKKVVVNRVLNINTCVNKIISTFNLKTRIKEEGNDEISVLSRDLNSMFVILEKYSNKMKYISEHDIITKLLNRRSIEELGQSMINNNEEFSLAFIDIDNFKKINDTYGHNIGDEVLCKIAEYLITYDNKNIHCGRLGGDEFIILMNGENNRIKILDIIKDISEKLKKDIYLKGINHSIKVSIGICHFPEHGESMVQILQNSDIAMYYTKNHGGNNYCIFHKELLEALEMEAKIESGIKKGEFEAYFQPISNLKNGKITGAEALVRWNTESGIISPDKFIPIAKKRGYIIDIDKIVINQSCKLIREFIDKGIEDFQISINTSFNLLRQETFLSDLLETIRIYNISVKNIKLEITEDETIEDLEYMVNLLNSIRECGIQVSLDDFGTGYSSFSYIKRLPLDVLKIDKSLLFDLEEDIRTENIIKTIIHIAHILDLTVTCEGVETKEQLTLLEKIECDNIQGYYLSKPLPINKFKEFFIEYMSKN